MKIKLVLTLVSNLTMYLAGAQVITATLQVSRDTPIGFHDGTSSASTNYGTSLQNAAYCVPGTGGANDLNGNRALIYFDLSVIPANATVLSAKLNLYALSPYGSLPGHTGANSSTLRRITQNWQEMVATWNNQPAATMQNEVHVTQSTSPSQNYSIDVLLLVQDMLNNPANSYGFKLQLDNEVATNALIFGSKDHANPALHPTLELTYRKVTVTPTGVEENGLNDALSIYPNPSQGLFKISGISPRVTDIRVTDISGRNVKTIHLAEATETLEINDADINSGVYFCSLIAPGENTLTRKILVDKK